MPTISDRVRSQCRLIAEHARLVTGAPAAILLLYDEGIRRLVTVASTGAEDPLRDVAIELIRRNFPGLDPLDLTYRPSVNAAVAAAFVGQRTQVNSMDEAYENIFPPPVMAVAHGLVGITTVVSCPVRTEGRALGLIRFLVTDRPTDAQQALMEAAANQIGLVLANAELAEQTRRQLAATQAMGEVARLAANAGMEATLQALADRSRELTDAEDAVVYLVDADRENFGPAAESLAESWAADTTRIATTPIRQVGQGLVGWVIASGEAAFVPDVRRDPRTRSTRTSERPEAVIAVPMRARGETLGCLRLSITGRRRFAEADLWLAQTLADEAALAVQSAQEQQQAREAARIEALTGASSVLEELETSVADLLRAAAPNGVELESIAARQKVKTAHATARRVEKAVRKLRSVVRPEQADGGL